MLGQLDTGKLELNASVVCGMSPEELKAAQWDFLLLHGFSLKPSLLVLFKKHIVTCFTHESGTYTGVLMIATTLMTGTDAALALELCHSARSAYDQWKLVEGPFHNLWRFCGHPEIGSFLLQVESFAEAKAPRLKICRRLPSLCPTPTKRLFRGF